MAESPLTGRVGHSLVCALFLCGLQCGCLQSATEEEAEHVIPAHRPTSLRHATWQLVTRWQQFASIDEPARQAVAKWQQEPLVPAANVEIATAELSDIVRWLPEIAAESELKRAEWEAVVTLSEQLERKFPLGPPEDGSASRGGTTGAVTSGQVAVSGLLLELAKLAQADISYEELIQSRDRQSQPLPSVIDSNPATTEQPATMTQPATTADPVPTSNGAA